MDGVMAIVVAIIDVIEVDSTCFWYEHDGEKIVCFFQPLRFTTTNAQEQKEVQMLN